MWSKMISTTWLSWSTRTKCPRSAIFLNWPYDIMLALMCRNCISLHHNHKKVANRLLSLRNINLCSWLFNTQFDHETRRMKRKGDRYSSHTSLIVASMKRLLPVGLRVCFPSDQSLIMLAKNGFTQVSWKCINVVPIMTQLLNVNHSVISVFCSKVWS